MTPLAELEPILVKSLRSESARVERPSVQRPPVERRPVEREPLAESPELDPLLVTRLRRPEATTRRSRATRSTARPAMLKTALTIVVAAAAFAFAGRVAAFAVEPVLATYRVGQEIRALQGDLKSEAAINAQLAADIAYLKTPAGIEQQARRRGYTKPGEVALAMVRPESEVTGPLAPRTDDADAPARPMPIGDRIASAVETCLAVLGGRSAR